MMQSTRDRWAGVLAEFEASGLTVARFCGVHRIPISSFYSGRWVLRERAQRRGLPNGPGFVEAVVRDEHDASIVVECRGGRRVVVPRGFDRATLSRVVATLEEPAPAEAGARA